MKVLLILCSVCGLASFASAQGWSGPYQLTDNSGDNINPSAIREWVDGTRTRLVWQSDRNGNWDIYSRLCRFQSGNGWDPEMRVCTEAGDDVTPAVVARFDVMEAWVYWCVWEKYESPSAGRIVAAHATAFDTSWSAPVEIGRCLHSGGDSARPSLMVIENPSADTVWAAWTEHDTDGYTIRYSYTTRTTWSQPAIAYASPNPIRHARLGRGESGYTPCPMLVWEAGNDIWYARYVAGAWQAPTRIEQWASVNRNPEIVSYCPSLWDLGPAIVWQSAIDGDTAIYGAWGPTFDSVSRWCDSPPCGGNCTPCGTPAMYTVFDDPYWVLPVWASDRSGNFDIYSRTLMQPDDGWVDRDTFDDINPTLTTMGLTQSWVVWQSNRTGRWDLFASTIYVTGVGESSKPQASSSKLLSSVMRRLPAGAAVFDAMGRRVHDPKPGVYFVRDIGRGVGDAGRAHKVVVTR